MIPSFSVGTRLTFDKARDRWCLLAPERLFEIDDQAAEVLRHVDGKRTLSEIIAALAGEYDAAADIIGEDVKSLFSDLTAKGLMVS